MDKLFRWNLILKILDREGKGNPLSCTTIHQRLTKEGADIHLRSIQRDMVDLKQVFPEVRCREETNQTLWWVEKSLSRLAMTLTDALNLIMIMDHASRFGMAPQVERLSPLREYAESLLKNSRPKDDLSRIVTSNTRFITLQPSVVNPAVLTEVQQALLNGNSLEVMYQKRGSDEPKPLRLHPLGLSYQDSNIYLSCVFEGLPQGEIAALPLHRFKNARKPFYDIAHPKDFDIQCDRALSSLISRKTHDPVEITLKVSQALSERLQENPLTTDQVLERGSNGWWLMTGSIHLSQGLDLWLLSQGEHLEVLKPALLREQIAMSVRRTAELYANDSVRHGSSPA